MKRAFALILTIVFCAAFFTGCAESGYTEGLGNGWEPVDSLKLDYATQFAIDYYEGGFKLITLADNSRFFIVPEGSQVPKGISRDITVLRQPRVNIYLAATAAMCHIDALDVLDNIKLSGSKAESWYVENARRAMEEGRILYAGKYSEPDYEMIVSYNCPLAIESTMIAHSSEVKSKLEQLGIPVFIDQSSNEGHPLGRTEWVKLYGALFNKEKEAEELFDEQKAYVSAENLAGADMSVVFFSINSSGMAVVRRPGDYLSKMMKIAGGRYVFENMATDDSRSSTMTLEMESFFASARDADCILYNSTIGGEIYTIDEMVEKNPVLADFKAVKDNNVWCTSQNMYQESLRLGEMIGSFNMIFSGRAYGLSEVPFFHRLYWATK